MERWLEDVMRPKYIGYSQHNAECIFKCPKCGRTYGGWTFAQYDDVITCKCKTVLSLKESGDRR